MKTLALTGLLAGALLVGCNQQKPASEAGTAPAVGSLADVKDATSAFMLPRQALDIYLLRRDAIVLTDDYAPVDNMLAPVFADRFVDETTEE